MKPSLKTVAGATGVSLTTVSNAYNRPERLSAELRERIWRVAAEQGYPGPDPAARSLRSRRSGAIGLLFSIRLTEAVTNPYCTALLAGITAEAEETRSSVVLIPVGPHRVDGLSVDDARRAVDGVRQAVVDGAIADGMDDDHPALRVLHDRRLPVVRSVDTPGAACVLIDDRSAARTLGEHLAELGHREVVLVADTKDGERPDRAEAAEASLPPYGRLRLAGLRDVFGARGVRVVAAGRNARQLPPNVAEAVLAGGRTTAAVATTDLLALGLLDALPGGPDGPDGGPTVSVAGFDDVPEAAAGGLTTTRQPIHDKGRTMAQMLLDPDFRARRVVLPSALVVRGSTAPAPVV